MIFCLCVNLLAIASGDPAVSLLIYRVIDASLALPWRDTALVTYINIHCLSENTGVILLCPVCEAAFVY